MTAIRYGRVIRGCVLDTRRNKMFVGHEFEVVAVNPKGEYGPFEIPADAAEDHRKSGFIEYTNAVGLTRPNAAAVDTVREIASIPKLPVDQVVDRERIVIPNTAVVPAKVTAHNQSPPSPWTFDPASLQGRSLEQLNATIAGRMDDATRAAFTPFSTERDAIAFLSADYRPSTTPPPGIVTN